MKKVAIVGVEGSGKTVMLAGLGDLYSRPDENGYFLSPQSFGTHRYVTNIVKGMREGRWPAATSVDTLKSLDWSLKRQEGRNRPEQICEISFLDFAGEVYRAAFGISEAPDAGVAEQVEALKEYLAGADYVIVLINLRDIIDNVQDERTEEAMWITNKILETALSERDDADVPRAAIVLSQADNYAAILEKCGGAPGTLEEYLPHVYNEYSWLDIFSAQAVDKTEMDADGNIVPARDFTTEGLKPIMDWVLENVVDGDDADDEEEVDEEDEDQPSDTGGTADVDIGAIKKYLVRAAKEYACDDLFFPSSPKFPAKLSNMIVAVQAKCNLDASDDEAIALLDCTVFGSAKNGVLFCRSGFYTLNDWAGSVNGFVSWKDFVRKGNVRKKGVYDVLLSDEPSVGIDVSGSDINADKTVMLFKNLRKVAGGSR